MYGIRNSGNQKGKIEGFSYKNFKEQSKKSLRNTRKYKQKGRRLERFRIHNKIEAEASNIEKFVLDSSVVIKWFTLKVDKQKAENIKKRFLEGKAHIAVPDLLLYEVSNGLRYLSTLSKSDIKGAVSTIFDLGIGIVVPEEELIHQAIEISKDFGTSLYDAIFISLAKILNYELLTADQSLHQKTKILGFVRLL